MIKRLIIISILIGSIFPMQRISAQGIDESEMKAVVLEQFSRFIEWDDTEEMNDKNKPFTIAVWGNTKFTKILKKVYNNRKIKGKNVKIIEISEIKDMDKSQILFISNSQNTDLYDIINYANNKNVLTITDNSKYKKNGIHFYIYFLDNKIRFSVNTKAVRETKIRIDHLLLKLCEIIE